MKLNFLRVAGWLCLLLGGSSCATKTVLPRTFSDATPLVWSVRLADSEMARQTNAPKWDYTVGLFTLSLLKLNESLPDARRVRFVEDKVGSLVAADGRIQGYRLEEFQLDAINPGKTLLALTQCDPPGASRYFSGCGRLVQQLQQQPRTPEGGFWHKQRYPNQMWLDGLYMAAPFYAAMGRYLMEPADAYAEVAKQFRLVDEHTYDARTGLNYHAWDAAQGQPWANPVTGCSSNFWGRAEGWYAMALVDTLDYFPTNHPARAQILATFQQVAAGIVKWQDARTGVWWQVLDQGARPGNYREATASAMFVYALAKGVNHGYLSRAYLPVIEKGYAGILRQFIRADGAGQWLLTQCCQVAGLSSSPVNGRRRDGSYGYYLSEPIVVNDLKGVGPFILAGLEMQTLTGGPP